MTLISDVAAKLIALALGGATAMGTNIFAYRFPPSPINCICIFPLAGYVPDEVQGGDGIDYPGFQIQVRNASVTTAMAYCEAIRLGLNGVDAGDYTIFTNRSLPIDLTNPDDLAANGGPAYRFSVDFETTKVR